MATQLKITAFFSSPKVTKPSSKETEKGDEDVSRLEDQSEPIYDQSNSVKGQDDLLEVRGDPTRDQSDAVIVPMVAIDEQDNPNVLEDDYDSDEVQKPRMKTAKKAPDSSDIKRKQTPKRKAPKIEDGIIGMKVRSPTNGRD